MPRSGIQAKCRRCGKEWPVEEFVLDPVYKMMVCPACVKGRHLKEKVAAEVKSMKKSAAADEPSINAEKPKDWDNEDEYLERAYNTISKKTVQVEKVDNEKVRYKCPNCKYPFIYNVTKKTPPTCPYCDSEIFPFSLY